MALAAAGRDGAARRLLQAMREYGAGGATTAPVVRDTALPLCEAVLAHRRGEHERVLELIAPRLDDLRHLGGSHAQQDVLVQLCLDSAVKAQNSAMAKALRERRYRN